MIIYCSFDMVIGTLAPIDMSMLCIFLCRIYSHRFHFCNDLPDVIAMGDFYFYDYISMSNVAEFIFIIIKCTFASQT